MTPTPEIERRLAEALGSLRRAHPAFERDLEARLLARLPAARPWWRQVLPRPARQTGRGALASRRRLLAGLGVAAAGVLALSSAGLPFQTTGEASASEILERAEALAGNPLMANLKSFHLTATSRSIVALNSATTRTATIEQWYVPPNRMRAETRSKTSDGKDVVSGVVQDGEMKRIYVTPGATEMGMVAVIAPPLAKTSATAVASPGPGPVYVRQVERKDASQNVFTIDLKQCRQSRRSGEETVAGRRTYVVETDFANCLPQDAPDKLPDKHVTWVDQETYLPLKMEEYGRDGKLRHSYEVTKIEYDVAIPDSIFRDIPPRGTELKELKDLPMPDGKPGLGIGTGFGPTPSGTTR